jgi:peroxiredoxin
MKTIAKYFVFAAAGAAALALNVARAAVEVGKPAPDFTLTDTKGEPHKLSDYKGKVVVLEWVNSGCPIVRAHYSSKNMQNTQAAAAADGVVWLQINTSAPGSQGNMSGAEAEAWQKKMGVTATAYLQDNGKVARVYHATNTPHMFVVDKDGKLAYQGAIDSGDSRDISTAKNYVKAALASLKDGKPVEPAATKAYGCAIHYPRSDT